MLRDANDGDLLAMVAIYNASVPGRSSTADLEPVPVESRREWFASHGPDHHPIWIVERDGEVAG